MFGSPETTAGGNALKFYSSVRLDIRRIGALKRGDEVYGNETRVKVESWLEKKPAYDAFADCLKKLKGMINEGQKTEKKERYLKKEDVAKDEDLFI